MSLSRIWQLCCMCLVMIGVAGLAAGSIGGTRAQSPAEGVILTLDGPVTPTSAEYLSREIDIAGAAGAELIIIEINTPGGLVSSMQKIVQAMLASEVPVATYVSPQGSRSASAGLYIMYAAHISAMAPATNTGAATPIEIGGGGGGDRKDNPFEGLEPAEEDGATDEAPADETDAAQGEAEEPAVTEEPAPSRAPALGNEDAMRAKAINDSVAYIRALAEERGRNADWAERAVREAVSVTSNAALELGVIDLVADDLEDLLAQIDGREIELAGGDTVVLDTTDMQLRRIEPQMWEKILGFFADPNVAAILLSLGTLGITAEIWNPGSIFPGALGVICLLLAFYSFQILPYNALALGLMGVGLVLIVLEAYTPTFGIAGVAGLLLFGIGLYFLFPDQFRISTTVIVSILAICGGILALILFAIVGSRSHGPLSGAEAIKKQEGRVESWDPETGTGIVIVDGERWKARSKAPLQPGEAVKVVEIDGLVLDVRPVQSSNNGLSRFVPGMRTQKT